MIDTPQLIRTPSRLTAVIHLTVRREEIRHVMGPGLEELIAVVKRQKIKITGPWFNHHRKMDPEIFDFEISVPVANAVAAAGRVKPGEWPAMRVARTIYHGGYEGLAGAWSEFDAWILANGHKPAEDLWECYLLGPETDPDPAGWRTELNRPLLG